MECNKETSPFAAIGSSANDGTYNSGSCARYYDWINLRNPLGQHGNTGQPYSLAFRVKFWVPAHLILQESVRNIFYMQARVDLLEGRLRAPDWPTAAKLGALLAHGDEVKFDRNALTCEDSPGSNGSTNTGIEIMDQTKASTTSAQMANAMHNRHIDDDDDNSSIASTSDISVVGCVSLGSLGSSGKDSISKSKKRKLSKQKASLDDDDESDSDTADICEYSPLRIYEDYVIHAEECAGPMPDNFCRQIAGEHGKLVKTTAKSAKYWLLQSIFKLNGFGEETFSGIRVAPAAGHHHHHHNQHQNYQHQQTSSNIPHANHTPSHTQHNHHHCHDSSSTQRCDISVGPHGLLITTPDEQTR